MSPTDFIRANEQYAQVGILLIPNTFRGAVPWPAGVTLENGLDEYAPVTNTTQTINLSQEMIALLNSNTDGPPRSYIDIYYVDFFFANGSVQLTKGMAIWASQSPNAKYSDTVFMSAFSVRGGFSRFTLAHEIGHVLLDDGRHTDGDLGQVNLMYKGTSLVDELTATKRLNSQQDGLIHQKRPNLLK